jgi:outer membrane receptor protein involved in Fe transport
MGKNLPSSDNTINTFGLMQRNTLDTSYGEIIFGIDGEYTKSSLKYNQNFELTIIGWGGATYKKGAIFDYDVIYSAFAPYISNVYNINEKLKLTLGGRYDYNSFNYTNNLTTGNDSSGVYYRPASKTNSFTHFSPKVSLGYAVNKNINTYIRYANGFTIPSATKLYSMKDGYKEVALSPEVSDTYEVGYKTILKDRGYFETNIYYMIISDVITRATDSNGDRYYYNGEKTIHKGIELTYHVKLSKEFSSKIAYSYSKHNFKDDVNYNNNEMREAPNHTGNLRLFYSPVGMKKLTLMTEMQYVGSYWMNDDNSKKYDGYNVYNLKSSYKKSKNLSVYAKVTNISDEKYATSASSDSWGDSYTPANPRQIYAGVEYIF